MGFFKSVFKKVGDIGSHLVKKVGPHILHGLRDFTGVASQIGDIGHRLATSWGHPNIGEGIRRGLDVAGKVSNAAGMAGHLVTHGNMGMHGSYGRPA